jgi:hypothetical protein
MASLLITIGELFTIKIYLMKTLNKRSAGTFFSKILLTVFTLFFSVCLFAQDATKSVDVNINTNSGGGFFTSPWVWVVGGAVFILLLVALLRGNSSRRGA